MDVSKLFDTAVAELERMLSSKSVIGEPIKIDGTTIIPLVSLGVGFGAGGGEAPAGKSPGGMGTGGGGGVKPVGVLIIDGSGVRLETIQKTGAASVLGKIAENVTEIARTRLAPGEAKKLEA